MSLTQVNQEFAGLRLDKFLCKKFDISFGLAQKIIRGKKVRVNDVRVDASYKTAQGDQVEIFTDLGFREQGQKQQLKISDKKIAQLKDQIIFRDENIIALNKPSGLSTQGGSGVAISVDDYLPYLRFDKEEIPQLVHRLDKDTSGLLLIARNGKTAELLTAAFKNKTIRKTYLALVVGLPKKNEGVINIPICKKFVGKNEKVYRDEVDGKEAITEFRVLEKFKEHSLMELHPLTGRTHQLRVHCKELGHAIIGDVKYGGRDVIKRDLARRVCLHAKKIVLQDYFGKVLEIETPLPDFLLPKPEKIMVEAEESFVKKARAQESCEEEGEERFEGYSRKFRAKDGRAKSGRFKEGRGKENRFRKSS